MSTDPQPLTEGQKAILAAIPPRAPGPFDLKLAATPAASPMPDLDELWDADPNCQHDVRSAPGGGVKCSKCRGWFCY